MLLAVGHDNAQFISIALDGMLTSIHRSAIEHRNPRHVTAGVLGHAKRIAETKAFGNGRAPQAFTLLPGRRASKARGWV